jgi:CRP-like cAMP-binding protein
MEWPLLAEVPPEEVRELLKIARRRRFSRNEVVFHGDDPGESLHLIVKGRFAIRIMTPLGETATIAIRGPRESFGEMALVSETARRSATVAALEESETFCVSRDDFARLRRRYPGINQFLIAFLESELRVFHDRLLEALYVPVGRRVLRRLVELVEAFPGQDGQVEIPLTQEVLAELAGTSRATVNRVLNEEQSRKTVVLRRGRVVVVDRDELARRAR